MNRRWICSDVWMDILPSFERVELGLNLALLSDRFDILVDKHFAGKSELPIWRPIDIEKDEGPKAILTVWFNDIFMAFPLPDHPLPNKICFKNLHIDYIDHSVIEFLRSNKQIWDRSGTKLTSAVWSYEGHDVQPIWDVFVREIWPIFATNIRQLGFNNADDLDNLRRRTSPTILTDLDHLNSINTDDMLPDDIIADDGPNSTSGQALSKWLHMPSKNGQPKRLCCNGYSVLDDLKCINNFKETFRHATTSASYTIQFPMMTEMSIEPFEVVNEGTKEKLMLEKVSRYNVDLLLKRCPIIVGETATDQWENDKILDDKLNNVPFMLNVDNNCIGPLSPPEAEEEKEKADE